MDGHTLAWLVMLVSAAVFAVILIVILPNRWWRQLLILQGFALTLAPAPVPNFPGNWAPAFVVAVFESLFQIEGQPGTSVRILIFSAGVALLLFLIGVAIARRRVSTPAVPAVDESAAS